MVSNLMPDIEQHRGARLLKLTNNDRLPTLLHSYLSIPEIHPCGSSSVVEARDHDLGGTVLRRIRLRTAVVSKSLPIRKESPSMTVGEINTDCACRLA